MSTKHLGGDALPTAVVGGVSSWNWHVTHHNFDIGRGLCRHHAFHECYLYKWRSQRR